MNGNNLLLGERSDCCTHFASSLHTSAYSSIKSTAVPIVKIRIAKDDVEYILI